MKLTIKTRSSVKRIINGILNRMIDIWTNSNNADIRSNGELRCIQEYISSLEPSLSYTFLDIGANKGEYTELLVELSEKKKLNYSIHMFEPVEYSYQNIKKHIPQTHHIILNKLGVSDTSGSLDIFYNTEGSPLASLYERDMKEYNIVLNKKEQINLVRLDEYIQQHHIPHIHLLKIDIEGHEISAFRGLGEYLNDNFIDLIQFEYGGANIDSRTYLKDFFVLLEGKGFQLFKIYKNYLTPVQYNASMENFKHSNFIAVSKKVL